MTSLSVPAFDEAFYERFHDRLARYPRYDLAHDFIYLTLGPRSDAGAVPVDEATRAALGSEDAVVRAAALAERNRVLERELIAAKGAARQLRAQRAGTSWRLTAPLHKAGQVARSGRRIRP